MALVRVGKAGRGDDQPAPARFDTLPLDAKLQHGEGRGFYAVIAAATLGGVALCFTPTDPVKELFWAAVINGVIAVPIMVVMMLLATRVRTMGEHVIGPRLKALGWVATAAMAVTVAAMLLS